MINDLQLEIDHEGKIMYVWGLCPLIDYKETDEVPQGYKACSLVALLDKPPIENAPNPRGIPPSVIEAEISQPGSTGVRVILNEKNHVVTVIPGG